MIYTNEITVTEAGGYVELIISGKTYRLLETDFEDALEAAGYGDGCSIEYNMRMDREDSLDGIRDDAIKLRNMIEDHTIHNRPMPTPKEITDIATNIIRATEYQ